MTDSAQLNRRLVLKAGAWAAPALLLATALPAAAASDGVVLIGASQWDHDAGTGWASFMLSPPPAGRISESGFGFTETGLTATALQRSGFGYANWTVSFNADAPPGPVTFGLIVTITGYAPTIIPIISTST